MANNYFKNNYGVLIDVFNTVVDNYHDGIWETKEGRAEFKSEIISPYVFFIYNLNGVEIKSSSPLYKQIKFSDKLSSYCERYKKDGIKAFVDTETFLKFVDDWREHISDWLLNGLDDVLKKEEEIYYRKAAFENGRNNTQNQYTKFDRDKEDALLQIKNKQNLVNFG